ncbi:hypothetical protein OTU49_003774, partial [Cherax quadricarinatus]
SPAGAITNPSSGTGNLPPGKTNPAPALASLPQRPSQTSPKTSAAGPSSASSQKEANLNLGGFGSLIGGSKDKSKASSSSLGKPNSQNVQHPTPRPSPFGGNHAHRLKLSPSLLVLLVLLCTQG